MSTFRVAAAVACLCALFVTNALAVSQGFTAGCEALVAEARFSVVFEDAVLVRDNTRSLEELKNLSRSSSGPYHQVFGLTHAQAGTRQAWRIALLTDPDGTVCAVPSMVLTLSVQDLTVYLARELTSTCKRTIVDEHEMEHVGVWRSHFRVGARLLEPLLRAQFARASYFASADVAQASLRSRVDAVLTPLLKNLQDGLVEANRQIDSPQSYQSSAQRLLACP